LILPGRMEEIVRKIIFLVVFMAIVFNHSYAYNDINKDFWGYEAINDLTSRGILSGYPDGTFKPSNNITRAEFITVLMKIIEPNADFVNSIGYWAEKSISLAKDKNIILENDYSEFNPNKDITRREICLMVYRAFGELDDINIENLNNKKKFLDISEENEEEKRITAILSHIGVLAGYPDGSAGLDKFSSRAETCSFINNFMKSRCMLLSVINDNEFSIYDNGVVTIDISKLPYSLKKWQYSKDIPYVTTKINSIKFFPFNNPDFEYKGIFDSINNSDDIYLKYRKKFGEGRYVIAVNFETTNNTYDYETFAGVEFLHISFLDEDISIVDRFDTNEMIRQLNKNAEAGEIIKPGETLDTSAFYIVDVIPKNRIRFDRTITGLYDINRKENSEVTSFHSLIVKQESR